MGMRRDKGDSGIIKSLSRTVSVPIMPCADCYYSIFSKMQPK